MGVRAVFLTGFMASGKTTVGRELARRLGWKFIDLDDHIQAREQQSIPEIFRSRGETAFRSAETRALKELAAALDHDTVVALGGGAFAQPANRDLLREWPIVFLDVPADELWRRSSSDSIARPLRTSREEFVQLYQERLSFYRQASVVIPAIGKDPASVCADIEAALALTGVAGASTQDR